MEEYLMYVYPFVAYKALHIYVLLETVTLQIMKESKISKEALAGCE